MHTKASAVIGATLAALLATSAVAAPAHAATLSPQEAEEVTGIAAAEAGTTYVADEVLVTLKPGTTVDQVEDLLRTSDCVNDQNISQALVASSVADGTIEGNHDTDPMLCLKVADGASVAQAAAELEDSELVSSAGKNLLLYPQDEQPLMTGAPALLRATGTASLLPQTTTTNDARLNDQWGLVPTRVREAWDLSRCDGSGGATVADKNVTVAVLDNGCAVTHEDLKDRVVDQYDFNKGQQQVSETDKLGHGTHVSGIAAGTANNGIGIAGASYNANLAAYKLTNDYGSGASWSTLNNALDYILSNCKRLDIRVINISMGTGPIDGPINPTSGDEDVIKAFQLITKLREAGVLTVCSAGNRTGDSRFPYYQMPSDYDDCFSVINIMKGEDEDGVVYTRSDKSNYNTAGTLPTSKHCTKDISAPGAGIISASNEPWRSPAVANLYRYDSGTSMASPLVAGVAALCFAEDPTLTPDDVQSLIQSTANAEIVDETGWSEGYGYGMVDAYAAVSRLIANADAADIPSRAYDGTAYEPDVTLVAPSGAVLEEGVDYTVEYRDNVQPGTATATIRGMGALKGTKSVTYQITSEPEPTPAPVQQVVMYRLYNPNTGEHFYTDNRGERDAVRDAGWTYEGHGWTAPSTGTPVYRLYNAYAGDHHYTTSEHERDVLVTKGWTYEGVGWHSGGPTPLWRQYNPNATTGTHNFTPSAHERDALVALGWRDEGVAWFGLSS